MPGTEMRRAASHHGHPRRITFERAADVYAGKERGMNSADSCSPVTRAMKPRLVQQASGSLTVRHLALSIDRSAH